LLSRHTHKNKNKNKQTKVSHGQSNVYFPRMLSRIVTQQKTHEVKTDNLTQFGPCPRPVVKKGRKKKPRRKDRHRKNDKEHNENNNKQNNKHSPS